MRVIAGTLRHRTLLSPVGRDVTRPITDRVKQSLFDRLWSMGLLDAGHALDLFAGTGSLGIEALSRGVAHCTFVERNRSSRSLLERNLANFQLTARATVLGVDALWPGLVNLIAPQPLSLVFCDPPYALAADPDTQPALATLIQSLAPATTPDAALVLRTAADTPALIVQAWAAPTPHRYGSTCVHLYTKP